LPSSEGKRGSLGGRGHRKGGAVDSTGIAVIVGAHQARESGGRRLAVCSPGGQVRRVLYLTGVSKNGLVFENAADALAEAGDRVETQVPDDPSES